MKNNHLVTVRVSSYNSEDTIIDTLKSIYNQTYSNIELIVSDDCSSDNTVDICTKWLEKNQARFTSTTLLTHPVNTGIPANINRAIKIARGQWIKGIAADDLLLPTCIADNMAFIEREPNCKVVFSNLLKFNTKDPENIHREGLRVVKKRQKFNLLTAEEQYKKMISEYIINTPSLFINANLVKSIGYDERYRLIDHYPLILNILKNGCKIFYLDKETVLYRISNSSVSNKGIESKIFPSFYKDMYEFDKDYRIPYFSKINRVSYYYIFYLKKTFEIMGINKKKFPYKFLYQVLYRLNILRYF